MNCQRFENAVSELARGQIMETDVRRDALLHSECCERCSQRLTNEQTLTRALRALSAHVQSERAPDGLEFALRKAFCEQHAAPQMVVVAHSSRRYWLAAAAAVLLLLGGAVAIRVRETHPTPPENRVAEPATNPIPKDSPSPEAIAINSSDDESPKRVDFQPRRRYVTPAVRNSENRRASDVAANHAREIATEFIPLSYSSGVSLQDGGQIVRVELPRSALVKFGLPVNMDRLNEKVKADVWLGVDGMAHAIRFVQ